MKKILIILLILIFGSVLTLKFVSKSFVNSDTIIGRISNILNRNNKIDIDCFGINKSDVNIIWYAEEPKPKLVIENGKQTGKIGHIYGSNRFKIILKNGLEFKVGHFKTNNWHSHQYKIEIFKNNEKYKIKFIANGPDFESFEQDFDLNGLPNGSICGYFKNGKFSYKGNYVKGLKQGQFIYYYRNGKIRSTVDYLDDELQGYEIDFDNNGNIKWKTKYLNGKEIKENE